MENVPASGPARRPSGRYLATIRAIDGITTWTAYLFALLVIPLIVANVIEVFMRYALNSPTSWALDVTTMSLGKTRSMNQSADTRSLRSMPGSLAR